MADILDQIFTATKKFPGNAVGAPVDLANLVLGALTGKGAEGFTSKPVGGSEQLNELFGLGKSKGVAEDVTALIQSFATPGGAAKAAMAGMVLPAPLLKSFQEFNKAGKALKNGEDAQKVYEKFGIYKTNTDDILRAILSDEGAKLKATPNVKTDLAGYQSRTHAGPEINIITDLFKATKLEDLLDHPKLFELVPDLKSIPVSGGFLMGKGEAGYLPTEKKILMGYQSNEKEYVATLLHEIQHAVQHKYDMTPGGNPSQFYTDPEAYNEAFKKALNLKTEARKLLDAKVDKLKPGDFVLSDRYKDLPERQMYDAMDKHIDTLSEIKKKTFEGYKRLGGEAEARYTADRFTRDVDNSKVPTSQYDVPASETTVGATPVDADSVTATIIKFLTGK